MGIYTEEDLEKAYAIGYNEAVDDVNEYIDQESMEYNLDDEMDNYNEDYSAVEDMIFSENSRANKIKHTKAVANRANALIKKNGTWLSWINGDNSAYNSKTNNDTRGINDALDHRKFKSTKTTSPYLHVKDPNKYEDSERMKKIKRKIEEMKERKIKKNAGLAFRGRK